VSADFSSFVLVLVLLSLSTVVGGGTRILGCERRPGTTILLVFVYLFVCLVQ
jgi:hypothetical protein